MVDVKGINISGGVGISLYCCNYCAWLLCRSSAFLLQPGRKNRNKAFAKQCNTAGALWMPIFPKQKLDEANRDRILDHTNKIPIAFKLVQRDMPDVRKLKGLLRNSDSSATHCVENMAAHCIYVLRANHHKQIVVEKDL